MVTSITAEFDSAESAERAADRILSGKIGGVYSAKVTGKALSGNDLGSRLVSFVPTYANNFSMNYLTAVSDMPASKDTVPEPERGRSASACIVCDGSGLDEINAVLNSYGALNIRSVRHGEYSQTELNKI